MVLERVRKLHCLKQLVQPLQHVGEDLLLEDVVLYSVQLLSFDVEFLVHRVGSLVVGNKPKIDLVIILVSLVGRSSQLLLVVLLSGNFVAGLGLLQKFKFVLQDVVYKVLFLGLALLFGLLFNLLNFKQGPVFGVR